MQRCKGFVNAFSFDNVSSVRYILIRLAVMFPLSPFDMILHPAAKPHWPQTPGVLNFSLTYTCMHCIFSRAPTPTIFPLPTFPLRNHPPPLSLSLSISGESANYQRLIHEFLEKVRACGSDYRAALQVSLWRAHSLSLDVCICERVRVDACIPLHARVRWSKPEPLSSGATDV